MKWIAILSAILLVACFDTSVGSPAADVNSESDTGSASNPPPVLRSEVASLASDRHEDNPLGKFIPGNRFEQWKAEAAVKFYRALSQGDFQQAATYTSTPDLILAMADSTETNPAFGQFEVIDVVDDGVELEFLLPDETTREITVFVKQGVQGFLVDWPRTLQGQQ